MKTSTYSRRKKTVSTVTPHDQLGDPGLDLRATWATPRIGPAAGQRVAMPAAHRGRADDQACPPFPGQQPRQCGEQRPIGRPESRPGELPAQHRDLVAEHEQLDLIGGLAPSAQNDQLQEATQHPVAPGHDHVSILTDARSAGAGPAHRTRIGLSAPTRKRVSFVRSPVPVSRGCTPEPGLRCGWRGVERVATESCDRGRRRSIHGVSVPADRASTPGGVPGCRA
jgi:hypothetical protein